MFVFQIFVLMSPFLTIGLCKEDVAATNITGPKDMYVVRATVYQVGIITNKTDNITDSNAGHQEALTIYHNNGSGIDLSSIPAPLLTNVTAEKLVGVAPVNSETVPLINLQHLVSEPHLLSGNSNDPDVNIHSEKSKREVDKTPVEIIKGAAVIPSEAGVNSIAIPPLFNLSTIPVPVPNTSVVSYAKINTLAHSP